jgi:hypothetical protein
MKTTASTVAAVLCAAGLAACAGSPAVELGDAVTVAAGGASNPTVAVDAKAGAYYVAWVGVSDGTPNVWLARSDDGATFAPPVRVNDMDGDAAPHEQAPAQVAAGPDGTVYVVWQNNTQAEGRRFPYSDLRLARSTDGGKTFEPAITVNDDAGGPPSSHTFHDIVVAGDGAVYVSWIDSRVRTALEVAAAEAAPKPTAHAAPASAGAAEAPAAGHESTAGHGHAGMAMESDPNLPGPEIRIARSTDGGRTFGTSSIAAADACPCCRTALAAGADGSVYVAWRDVKEGDIRDIVVARSTDHGETFSMPKAVQSDGWSIAGCPHAGPDIAVDENGLLHAAWYTGAEGRPGLYYAVSDNQGESFGEAAPLVSGEWVPVSQVKMAATADGVVVAWDDRRQELPELRFAAASGSDAPRALPLSGDQGASPAVAAGGKLRIVAWLDGETVRARTGR